MARRGNAGTPVSLERRYRDLLIHSFEKLTFKGISPSGKALSLPLADVYVELKAVSDIPDAADTYSAEERRLLAEDHRHGGDPHDLRAQLDSLRYQRWQAAGRRGHGALQRRSIEDALADPALSTLVILG